MRNGRVTASLFAAVLVLGAVIGGCSKTENPVTPGTGGAFGLSVSFSKGGAGVPIFKTAGTEAIDSLRLDSAVVVLAQIKFLLRADTASVDTSGHEREWRREDSSVTFKGPFVVRVRDTLAIDLGEQTLAPGAYDGIRFRIHRLGNGEAHHLCDRRGHRWVTVNDTSVAGSSVIIWGAVKKNGTWTPFKLSLDLELEFKIRGNFVINEATQTPKIALHFNMGSWFKNPFTGAVLDPTDPSFFNRELMKWAVRFSFFQGHGGHDRDNDGHPDD